QRDDPPDPLRVDRCPLAHLRVLRHSNARSTRSGNRSLRVLRPAVAVPPPHRTGSVRVPPRWRLLTWIAHACPPAGSFLSHQSRIAANRSILCRGCPARLNSWFSPGKISISASTPLRLSAA